MRAKGFLLVFDRADDLFECKKEAAKTIIWHDLCNILLRIPGLRQN